MAAPTPDIPLLAGLPSKDRAQVLSYLKQRTFEPGQIVVREGDQGLNLFIVISGRVRVERGGVVTAPNIGPGEFFGELALIEQHGRTATVVAEEHLTCYVVPAWEFRALLKEYPQMAVSLLFALIARIHASEHVPD